MFKVKYYILSIILLFFVLPSFAIDDMVEQQRSTSLTNLSDYTGETFFKTYYELEEERHKELKQQENDYYHQFRPQEGASTYRTSSKVIPPLKKLRLKLTRSSHNKLNKGKEIQSFDANGMPIEENEVIAQEASETQAMIRCKTLKYLPEENQLEATGNVRVIFPAQDTTLYSNRMTYDTVDKIIQLYDSVKVVREGKEIFGDYMKINLNEEVSFLQHPRTSDMNLTLEAENGYMLSNTIKSENGTITSDNNTLLQLRSSGFGERISEMIIPREDLYFLQDNLGQNKLLVKVDEIKIHSKGYHDTVKLKHPKIYTTSGKKVLAMPSMTFYTNKEHDYFEGNFPEIGSYSGFGMFAGPGVVFETPFGSTLKVIPTINHKNKLGFGGIAKFKSGTNDTELAYNTAANRVLLKGYQRLDDNLFLHYGMNSYLNEWFLGHNWLGYGGELLYEKGYKQKDFLYDNADLSYRHRISAGMFKENDRDTSNKKYQNGDFNLSTPRFKYMAELNQRLFSLYGDAESAKYNKGWKQVDINLVAQGSAALYGTGDTQFIGRIGPRLVTQYKFWRQELGYFMSAYNDETPLVTMDSYRYGHSNAYVREYFRLHKFLTLGLYGSYNLSNDNYDLQYHNNSQLREAAFYAAIGPDDLKLNLGYDFVRKNTYFGISMAMNTKGSTLDYKRLEIKNPDEIGKVKGEINSSEQYKFIAPPSPYKTKAIVEEIEDVTTIMQGENI